MYNKNKVELLRQRYPEGTRICLDSMENDPQPIPSGTMGTVVAVDDMGQFIIHSMTFLTVFRHSLYVDRSDCGSNNSVFILIQSFYLAVQS